MIKPESRRVTDGSKLWAENTRKGERVRDCRRGKLPLPPDFRPRNSPQVTGVTWHDAVSPRLQLELQISTSSFPFFGLLSCPIALRPSEVI
jgi:hypothetical protein